VQPCRDRHPPWEGGGSRRPSASTLPN
jgi:hypothetical protein